MGRYRVLHGLLGMGTLATGTRGRIAVRFEPRGDTGVELPHGWRALVGAHADR